MPSRASRRIWRNARFSCEMPPNASISRSNSADVSAAPLARASSNSRSIRPDRAHQVGSTQWHVAECRDQALDRDERLARGLRRRTKHVGCPGTHEVENGYVDRILRIESSHSPVKGAPVVCHRRFEKGTHTPGMRRVPAHDVEDGGLRRRVTTREDQRTFAALRERPEEWLHRASNRKTRVSVRPHHIRW